jgi:hypothetical protein
MKWKKVGGESVANEDLFRAVLGKSLLGKDRRPGIPTFTKNDIAWECAYESKIFFCFARDRLREIGKTVDGELDDSDSRRLQVESIRMASCSYCHFVSALCKTAGKIRAGHGDTILVWWERECREKNSFGHCSIARQKL